MDHTVNLFCPLYTKNRIEGVKEVYVFSEYYVVKKLRYMRRGSPGPTRCL